MTLSVVIVTWNSCDRIAACLASLPREEGVLATEIIVVDNASEDSTREIVHREFSWVRLRANEHNLGFTRACNVGIREARGQYVLFLNPDTVVQPTSLENMIRYMDEHSRVGALGPQLVYPDGRIQSSCRQFPTYRLMLWEFTGLRFLFPRSRLFGAWRMGYFDHRQLRPVDQPMGACLLLRSAALAAVGVLDENLEMFFSDVDICRRIKEAGWDIVFLPQAQVFHQAGSSIHRARPRMLVKSHGDCYRYFRKYRRSSKDTFFFWLLGLALMLSLPIRLLGAKIRSIFHLSQKSLTSFPPSFLSH